MGELVVVVAVRTTKSKDDHSAVNPARAPLRSLLTQPAERVVKTSWVAAAAIWISSGVL
jgi:hypothetical protein